MFVGTGSMAACTTDRWYFTREQLTNSPSRKCQIEPDRELSYRQHAANLIQDMGQRLQVNQLCINTAIVYMHRFYVFHSFSRFQRNSIAAAALFLAAKVEEQPHKLEYVIKVHHACLHRGGPVLDTKSDAYLQQAQELVINESILLQTLGFEVAVDHPHTHVVKCTQMIRASKDLAQTSYFMATNSLHLTTFCLQYKPTLVACVCIYLVAKWSQWEIMKSSDGKDWWEYVDPTVTKDLLDELTKEFLRIFEACPSRLKRRISNEKIPVMPHQSKRSRVKEGASESSTAKTTAASSASTSSLDSGLPGSNSFDGFLNSQESQGDGQGSTASGDTETDRPGLHEINMGLPMVESSLFNNFDSEYSGGTGYNVNTISDSKHGLPSSQSDSEYGKMGDPQGHPVKKSLKEYREQKERERIKTAKQVGPSKEGAPPRTSHTVSRPISQNLSGMKGNVNSPHMDAQRSRDKYSQGSQKQRLDDRKAERHLGTPLDPSMNPHTKAPGRPPDLKQSRDQRQPSQQRPNDTQHRPKDTQHRPNDSQHKPNDLEVLAARGATVTDSRYSKNSDQYHKPHQEPSKNNSDRKQLLGPNLQEKEHKKNGFENKDHGANSRPPEGVPKIHVPSSVAPSKSHGSGSQKHHHLETQKAHSSVTLPTAEPPVKQNPETLRPVKSEAHRSQRSENQVVQKSEKHRVPHPDMAKLHKSQSLKTQRSEPPKAPFIEKHLSQPAVPPLVPLSFVGQEQKVSGLPTQKVEPPLLIDHEMPKPHKPERVLLPQTETVKVEKSSTPALNRHNLTKPHKSEDPHLQRPEVLKVPKSDPGVVIKTEPAKVKSPGSSKVKAPKVTKVKVPELPKVQKSVGHKPQKMETPRLPKTDAQITPNNDLLKLLKTDPSELSSKLKPNVLPIKMVKQEPQIPPTPVVKAERLDAPRTQKSNHPQPPKSDPSKRHRVKVEPGGTHRPTTPKSQVPPLAVSVKLEKSPTPELTSPLSPGPKLKILEMAVLQADLNIKTEILDIAASSSKGAIRRKPQTPPSAKLENPLDKMDMPSSLKPVAPKQSHISNSYIPDKAKSQRAETVNPLKANTEKQHKPVTPKSQKSSTPRSRASPGASSQASKPSKAAVSETPTVAHTGEMPEKKKVVWESIKPFEVLKSGGSDQAPDSESVEANIDELINADIAALSRKQGFEPPTLSEPKPSYLEVNTVEPKERSRDREDKSLPKSYREKESHHRKRHSDEHRSKSSSHKHHRSSDHNRRGTPTIDAVPSPVEPAPTTDAAGDSQPHSILTTSTGIRLKIKGLSNSMNSGSSNNAKVESPSDRRQTGSPALRLKLNLAKMQANSDHSPEAEITPDRERGSSHRQHHHHHRKHKRHHKSRSHRGEDGGEPHRRKRSHSRSESISSGREESPAISSPAKKRAHGGEHYLKTQSILPSDQSLLRFPMPPADPNQSSAQAGYMDYNKHSRTKLQDNSPSLASTGQFSYNTSGMLNNAPLTTVTALPSSDGFSFYPYGQQQTDGHLPPPPPPLPRENLPPPPPPPM
ncbi:uncharacterized protein [Asterias amurensis]|uniref:uncharacterized protein isoform X2 n=1 Tax=Asterias amurensis TaxID=7602 RepID=UPI003AB6160B